MESYVDYLYFLLPSPLKKIGKRANAWRVFCTVFGRRLDALKKTILDVREMSMILTCPSELLPIFGQEREMPRLSGETEDAYRLRLAMKCEIAKRAGTREGILLALESIGYEKSRIEPLWQQDPARWAEFTVFLRGDKQSGVTDLQVIDAEVMKAKNASSKPSYGVDAGNKIRIVSAFRHGFSRYPICGVTICGTFPYLSGIGRAMTSGVALAARDCAGFTAYPMTGRIVASEQFYEEARNE